jgi:hypothetical protein
MIPHWLVLWYPVDVNNEAATKQDLADAVQQVTDKFARDLQENADKLTEAIRDSQTEVLRAFYDWARPVDTRLRHTDELVQRMGWLEERVAELERGKRLPPN